MSTMVSMATMPHREPILTEMLPLVTRNCDKAVIHFNGFKEIPEYIKGYPNVEPVLYTKNRGSIVRFSRLSSDYEYTFFLDDDILPTQQFFDISLNAAERLPDSVITFYGFNWDPSKGFKPRRIGVGQEVKRDTEVMGFGMGVSCIRSEYLPDPGAVVNNMNDISVGLHYARRGVRMVIPKHPEKCMSVVKAEKLYRGSETRRDVQRVRTMRARKQRGFADDHKGDFLKVYNETCSR